MWDPRGADVAQCGHVAVPREPTQTHARAYVARSISPAKLIWPTGVVILGDKIGGVY